MKVAEFLLGSVPLLLDLYADLYRKTDFQTTMLELESEYNVPKIKTYDFIIVGGGSAGCVLAGRLSEFFNVLLLEAGGNPPPGTTVPYYSQAVRRHSSTTNFFESVVQTNASLNNDGITASPTGKMLGGSASHNNMLYSRGSPKDYDNWAKLLNDDSFNYTNVLKYFKRIETFVGHKFGADDDEYYGNDGPILVTTMIVPILDLWFEAGRELGYRSGDPNGYQQEGFAPMNVAIRKGARSSSYVEYIKPHETSRNSLTVIRYANVSEILIDDDKRAYGVAYTRHGFPQIAHAENEIILSAGIFSSPLLLMKSGIGPVSILDAAEIPVKVSLEAVGKNLAEHPSLIMPFSANDSSLFPKMYPSDTEKISQEYHNGEGVLTVAIESSQCFAVSSKAEKDWPNIWIEMWIHALESADGEKPSITFCSVVGRPQSKGLLSLDTEKYKAGVRDDVQLALIDYKLLTHPDDIEVMLEGIKIISRIMETEAFKSINLTYAAEPDPACSAFSFLTDDYWKCKAQQDAITWQHMVGTCSLGPDSADSTVSVVDTKFRVRGVSNLRVVDASVIPEITNANLNAPVMMLAEKAAEDIINFYRVTETTTRSSTTASDYVSTNTISIDTTPSRGISILVETNKLFVVLIFAFLFKFCF